MRSFIFAALLFLAGMTNPNWARADDAIADCKAFFEKFERCIDALKGDEQDQARIFLRTIKATLGMSNDLNQGDPMYLGIMCKLTIEERQNFLTLR